MADEVNKIEYGLRNCYYSVATVDSTNKVTYDEPKRLPGAVTLSLDKSGDLIRFKADDIDYWTNANNQGYEGSLTLALVPDSFKEDVLGEEKTDDGVMLENADSTTHNFALMFEFQGDKKATRHVMFYCAANRPSVASQTKDDGNPNTTDLDLTVSPRPDNQLVKANTTPATVKAYDGWFKEVFDPDKKDEGGSGE